MNIFYLDACPYKAAEYQCDKHVVKMIVETAQLLSTAHHEHGDKEYASLLYKPTHKNHPCAIWTRQCKSNYEWLFQHLYALSIEYTKRYGKVHKTWSKLGQLLISCPESISNDEFTDPPQCMPEQYQCGHTVTAYRTYYQNEKASFATWERSPQPIPHWWGNM
jgi:hypothetical protein